MMTIALSAVVTMAGWAGGLHCGHDKVRTECEVCSDETPEVFKQIERLQSCSGWMARRKAARALRKFDWKCYPDAAEALAETLLHDGNCLVRQEAAASLARMRPCVPSVHEAVALAARCDASLLTRCSAKQALKALGSACSGPCAVCDAESAGLTDSPFSFQRGRVREPVPMDSSVEPLPPESMGVPESPSDLSPLRPRAVAPLPLPIPGPVREP
jgi:hypothetical protein